jgi:hypothetical protein
MAIATGSSFTANTGGWCRTAHLIFDSYFSNDAKVLQISQKL